MYNIEIITSTLCPLEYLNQQIKTGNLIIEKSSFLYQDFCTSDGVLRKVHKTAGRFYGGGIHQFSWDDIYKNGKLIFSSKSIELTYRYFAKYLQKKEKNNGN